MFLLVPALLCSLYMKLIRLFIFTVSKQRHPALRRHPEKPVTDNSPDCSPDFIKVKLDPDDYVPICTPNMESSVKRHGYKTTDYMSRHTSQDTIITIRLKRDVG